MKTILIPTDFTKVSQNAFNYALSFLGKKDSRILLLSGFNLKPRLFGKISEQPNQEHEQKLSEFTSKAINHSNIQIEQHFFEGSLSKAILKTIEKTRVDLIFMGVKRRSTLAQYLTTNDFLEVINLVETPILLIPQDFSFRKIDKVVYATDFDLDDTLSIRSLAKILGRFQPEITLVHISNGTFTDKQEKEFMNIFKKEIHTRIRYQKIEFQLLFGKNISERLKLLVKETNPDWLVMLTEKRYFLLDKHFQPSVTRKTAFQTQVPLLVFHGDLNF